MIGSYCIEYSTLVLYKGSDEFQEPLPTEDEALKCFIEYGEFRIQDARGQIIVSNTRVRMRPRTIITGGYTTRASNTISEKDLITFDGEEHAIMKFMKPRDFSVRALDAYLK